jgi:hypothetical protein
LYSNYTINTSISDLKSERKSKLSNLIFKDIPSNIDDIVLTLDQFYEGVKEIRIDFDIKDKLPKIDLFS